jgi:hypothetical protein
MNPNSTHTIMLPDPWMFEYQKMCLFNKRIIQGNEAHYPIDKDHSRKYFNGSTSIFITNNVVFHKKILPTLVTNN